MLERCKEALSLGDKKLLNGWTEKDGPFPGLKLERYWYPISSTRCMTCWTYCNRQKTLIRPNENNINNSFVKVFSNRYLLEGTHSTS